MLCYLKREGTHCVLANVLFERRLLVLFLSEDAVGSEMYDRGSYTRNMFITDAGRLDMRRVMEKFVEYYGNIYNDRDEAFVEKYGRKLFMLYVKPILNGTGNYYIEPETRDETRSDMVIDYKGERFVVEMKIWHGEEYNKSGEAQLCRYLDYFGCETGYMLSFNFNKGKERGVKEVKVGGRMIVEAIV